MMCGAKVSLMCTRLAMLFAFICQSCRDILNARLAKKESKYTLIGLTEKDKGFRFIIFLLTNIDECAVTTRDCDLVATCTNTVGYFTCA